MWIVSIFLVIFDHFLNNNILVEEWIYQYFTEELEENIPDAVVEEWYQYFKEENIPDAVENENIQAFVEEIDIIINDLQIARRTPLAMMR